MKSFNVVSFHLYDDERHNAKIGIGILFFYAYMADYTFKWNEFCCHGGLFLWQLQYFMNRGCLSNTVVMAKFTRILLKITANLIDKICYNASRMNEPSLTDSTKLWFLTLFKCVLLNIFQNVVRSLLSAGDSCVLLDVNVIDALIAFFAFFTTCLYSFNHWDTINLSCHSNY